MLELSLVECMFRLIPESFLMVLSIYVFSKTEIDKVNYMKSSVILGLLGFIIRKLPISYGIHTILCMIITIFIVVCISKIDIAKGIKSVILSYIVLFISEGINIFLLRIILGNNINFILSDNTVKVLLAVPSLILFLLILFIVYKIFNKGKNTNYDDRKYF